MASARAAATTVVLPARRSASRGAKETGWQRADQPEPLSLRAIRRHFLFPGRAGSLRTTQRLPSRRVNCWICTASLDRDTKTSIAVSQRHRRR
jgi:hypothetical protein